MGGADGGRARVEGCGKDAVLVERAFGAVSEVLSERGCGVKRNSRGGGEMGASPIVAKKAGLHLQLRAKRGHAMADQSSGT